MAWSDGGRGVTDAWTQRGSADAPAPPAAADAAEPCPKIGDHALIGDCGSAALISRWGSVDWMCLPRFDSPSLFAAILDPERGGRFRIAPTHESHVWRRYVEGSAVLETVFRTESGVLRLRDCMVAAPDRCEAGALWPEHQLLREVRCIEGRVEVEVVCEPRFDYGRRRIRPEVREALGVFYAHRGHLVIVRSEIPVEVEDGSVRGRCWLEAEDRRFVLLAYDQGEPAVIPPLGQYAADNLEATLAYWRDWSARCDYQGPHREQVERSAITLKLMTFAASGAVVAAPTTSLPERIGGVRNWDYRFCWLRDACFTLRALFELGYTEEGTAFFSWLLHTTHHSHARLRVLYDVFGGTTRGEREIDFLAGHRGSRPVRVGNAADDQLQLDLYGELVAAAFEYVRRGGTLGRFAARLLIRIGDRVCGLWQRPDRGIWEVRSGDRRHTHSVAMCWVALDRLLAMDRDGDLVLSARRRTRFERTAHRIRDAIEASGYSRRLKSYVGVFDGDSVDASLLLLALYGYVEPDAPRFRSTWERIRAELGHGALLMRYAHDVHGRDDGLPPGEGAFGVCSFWAAEYLARAGRLAEAETIFEALCRHANDVGLYGEELDLQDGTPLGNFPQAFTHVGLVGAALAIAEARGKRPESGLAGHAARQQSGHMPDAEAADDLHTEKPAAGTEEENAS
ncbi:MAG: glycoside hydrolase family 15 protein [Myxococcota bacterium]